MKLHLLVVAFSMLALLLIMAGLAGVVTFVALPASWAPESRAFGAGLAGLVVNSAVGHLMGREGWHS